MFLIVISSTLLQFAAGFLALRLIADSGRSRAWILLAAGIFAMAFRRLHTLIILYRSGDTPSLEYELLGLGISVLIFAGIYHIAPLLREMREAADHVAESEERYRTVAMFAHGWEYWMTPEGNYVYVSPGCERISGYRPEAFMNDPQLFHSLIHPEDKEIVLNRFSSINSIQKPLHFDCRIIDAQGAARWVAYHSVPVHGEGGVFLGVRASIRDIDQRKKLETELRDSRALYQGLVENSRSIVLRLDGDGVITFANRCAFGQLGMDEEGVIGHPLRELLLRKGDGNNHDAAEAIDGFLDMGERLEMESEIVNADGARTWIEWAGTAIADAHGAIRQYVCVGIDVTRRKALDKLKEDMTRIVNHDMRSPLSGIIGIPRHLRQEDNLTEEQKEMLAAVEDAGSIMLDLINQSLDLYKLEAGTYAFQAEEFDLLAMLREQQHHLGLNRPGGAEVQLTLAGSPPPPNAAVMCHADRSLIYTLFCNLVRNALDASQGKPVRVDVTANGEVRVSVSNAGTVPESIRDTFFDKYVTCGKAGGTGLGTYSARLIARQHGGDIAMHTAEGQGTVVTVTLPHRA